MQFKIQSALIAPEAERECTAFMFCAEMPESRDAEGIHDPSVAAEMGRRRNSELGRSAIGPGHFPPALSQSGFNHLLFLIL